MTGHKSTSHMPKYSGLGRGAIQQVPTYLRGLLFALVVYTLPSDTGLGYAAVWDRMFGSKIQFVQSLWDCNTIKPLIAIIPSCIHQKL